MKCYRYWQGNFDRGIRTTEEERGRVLYGFSSIPAKTDDEIMDDVWVGETMHGRLMVSNQPKQYKDGNILHLSRYPQREFVAVEGEVEVLARSGADLLVKAGNYALIAITNRGKLCEWIRTLDDISEAEHVSEEDLAKWDLWHPDETRPFVKTNERGLFTGGTTL